MRGKKTRGEGISGEQTYCRESLRFAFGTLGEFLQALRIRDVSKSDGLQNVKEEERRESRSFVPATGAIKSYLQLGLELVAELISLRVSILRMLPKLLNLGLGMVGEAIGRRSSRDEHMAELGRGESGRQVAPAAREPSPRPCQRGRWQGPSYAPHPEGSPRALAPDG
jgi:hypothetical protein